MLSKPLTSGGLGPLREQTQRPAGRQAEKWFHSWNHTHEVSQVQSWRSSEQQVASHPGYKASALANHFPVDNPTGK